MAAKDRSSIQSLMASGADTIPREYHRKVLKKIAQLTKVKTANQWEHFDVCYPPGAGLE